MLLARCRNGRFDIIDQGQEFLSRGCYRVLSWFERNSPNVHSVKGVPLVRCGGPHKLDGTGVGGDGGDGDGSREKAVQEMTMLELGLGQASNPAAIILAVIHEQL